MVFGKVRFILLALCVAVLFYMVNVFLFSYKTVVSLSDSLYDAVGLLILIALHFNESITVLTFGSILTLSVFAGMLVSLLFFRYRREKRLLESKVGFVSSVGIFIGVLAPGCASCGVGLVAVLGLSGSLALLPFRGAELAPLAALILFFTVLYVSARINAACSLPLKKMKGGRNK